MKKIEAKKIGLSAMLMAIGLILPIFTGQIKEIGDMLLPMHIPVFLCAFFCGWKYGLVVGVILPLLRSVVFGMPALYPNAIAMALELGTYGCVCGVIYSVYKKHNLAGIYVSMITAMAAGRVVWGIAEVILVGISGMEFTWELFVAGAFTHAIPGIILQLIVVPVIVLRIKPLVHVQA